MTPPALTTDDTRLHALDLLRGLALFGMVLVHFHQHMRVEVTGLEDLIGWGVYVLVEQKAWGTFAFLFGVGFAILLRRLESRQAPVVLTYLRRLAALAAFGIVAEVGFGFHILFSYACWGVGLLVVRRWSTRALLAAALIAVMARPVALEVVRSRARLRTRGRGSLRRAGGRLDGLAQGLQVRTVRMDLARRDVLAVAAPAAARASAWHPPDSRRVTRVFPEPDYQRPCSSSA